MEAKTSNIPTLPFVLINENSESLLFRMNKLVLEYQTVSFFVNSPGKKIKQRKETNVYKNRHFKR